VRLLSRVVLLLLVCAVVGLGAVLLVLSLNAVVAVASALMVAVLLWRLNRRSGGGGR